MLKTILLLAMFAGLSAQAPAPAPAYAEGQVWEYRTRPGEAGSLSGAHCDVARTVCRRAERAVVALDGTAEAVPNSEIVRYLNRLSDVLWLMARVEEKP